MTSKARGFTLVEVLVVLSLLSLLMLGMVSALLSLGQAENRIDQRTLVNQEDRSVRQLLRNLLATVSSQNWRHASLSDGTTAVGLILGDQSIEWVGNLPARHGPSGRHFLRLHLQPDETTPTGQLALRHSPWSPGADQPDRFPDWANASTHTLLTHVERFNVSARSQVPPPGWPDSRPWSTDWQNPWPAATALPEEIRILLRTDGRDWLPIIIAVQSAPGTSPRGDGFSVGGSTSR